MYNDRYDDEMCDEIMVGDYGCIDSTVTPYLKEQIITICHSMLRDDRNRVTFNAYKFSRVFNILIDNKTRAEIVCTILEDFIALKDGGFPKYHFSLGYQWEYSEGRIRRVFESVGWGRLSVDPSKKRRELFNKISDGFFEGEGKENFKNKRVTHTPFSISEFMFATFIDKIDDVSMSNNYGIKEILLEKIVKIKRNTSKNAPLPENFEKIKRVFHLTDLQIKILFFYYIRYSVNNFNEFVRYTNFDYTDKSKVFYALSEFFGVSQHDIKREFRKDSKLIRTMLLDNSSSGIELSYHINEFLQNQDTSCNVFDYFFEKDNTRDAIKMEAHMVLDEELKVIRNLFKSQQGTNILLYGPPGTGKTEFTKSLGKEFKIEMYKLRESDDDEENFNMLKKKRSVIEAAQNMLNKESVLVVDEAEVLLNSANRDEARDESDHKAWLNKYMEEHGINVIWITNDMTMHPSTRRRFDISIKFNEFTRSQRLTALKNIQKDSGLKLFNLKELTQLAKDFDMNPGMLSLPFKKVATFVGLSKDEKKEMVITLLKSQEKMVREEEVSEKGLESFYNPDYVNTSVPEKEIFDTIKSYFKEGKVRNLCVLFQGLPGTGKTEYAKYLAEKLEKEMSIKRASDILSKWWGETEQNIAKMFKESERDGDILFLDECDSLFKPREGLEYSWMVSETNELLTQMERFKGVLICATNFVENIDKAAMRRFHLKVEFKDLLDTNIPKIYKSFFGNIIKGNLKKKEKDELKGLKNLNPGDFKAVYNALVFKKNLTHQDVIDRLKTEILYKKTKKTISLT